MPLADASLTPGFMVDYYHPPCADALGLILLRANHDGLTEVAFVASEDDAPRPGELTARAKEQLEAYFTGARRDFDLPLAPQGTDFQRRVWEALASIPFGETRC
ncbi:methylated-DNA-[protein]-cysteine S-methyltransferase [Franzmannia pantelleriensis]|uniref:Methylated-DNA-[protein]-cysteine S-methyltransferase n=1 Tax=Franzmannia pantelleriensis TaxID=48727 RepID=A0A1G9IDX1_9GAMM|nr:methylated-DNA-[protein]-cysteine S-methyltransferase [Halomonas pantelleriensis]